MDDLSYQLNRNSKRLKQNKTDNSQKLTPMMAQYLAVKEQYHDILLFYRMGDFYEMFLHDAEIASEALGIALTHRGEIEGKRVQMCGVPVHAADNYLAKLIKLGHRVAVCEQSETPEAFKKRGGKGPLPRDVVRVITPGTLQEDGLLDAYQNNFLAAIGRVSDKFSLAWADMSTGSFQVQECAGQDIDTILTQLNVAEFVYPEDLAEKIEPLVNAERGTALSASAFNHRKAEQTLFTHYDVSTLQGMGQFSAQMLSAAGGLLAYLQQTQLETMPYLKPLSAQWPDAFMVIDTATRKSLELSRTLTGERKGSLLSAIDKTSTAGGARLLHTRLSAPLTGRAEIEARLGLATWFTQNPIISAETSDILSTLPDIERALSRLVTSRGGPRDLAALAQGLFKARSLSLLLNRSGTAESQLEILALAEIAQNPAPLAEKITPALADELPLLARDGHFIRQGYDSQLDELRQMRDESRRLMAGLQANYAEITGVSALKIKHNNVLGYHIEVRAAHADKLMSEPQFIHRQTTAQAVRFTTTELAEMEQALGSASDKALALEVHLFEQLVREVISAKDIIAACADAVAALDVACSTAKLADLYDYCCPQLRDDTSFTIEAGRHPVVEQAVGHDAQFIANDCLLSEEANLWLLTGPNMAGKSTYLRQNAHMAILAQAGFFVPARRAEIGIVDKIFSRVGASDDLARGQSTFMVEMVETAAILNQSTSKSLVILDEIGRGTATWDGLAIAWACLEYLHNNIGCRALFATHYHELTALQGQLTRLRPHAMQVKEWKGAIIFLHQVASGAADKSYGVHVARLAGLPKSVTKRAAHLVSKLEAGSLQGERSSLPLFDLPENSQNNAYDSETESDEEMENLRQMIAELEPDSLTPKQALSVLYDLKSALAFRDD